MNPCLADGAGFSSASEREDFDCPRRYDVEGEGHGFEAPSARVQRALRGFVSFLGRGARFKRPFKP